MNGLNILLIIVRLCASAILFTLTLIAASTYRKHLSNPIIRYGGLALLITSIRNLAIAALTAWWIFTHTNTEISRGAQIFTASSNAIAAFEHIILIVLLMYALGYISFKPDKAKKYEKPESE